MPWKVAELFRLTTTVVDPIKFHLDCWSLKKLFSLGIRRWGTEPGKRKDPWLGLNMRIYI